MITDPLGYYAILNVDSNADDAIIKQSYRELAKVWHPDHNTNQQALENFQKLSVAYDVLKDESKRLTYDMLALAYEADKFPEMQNLKPYQAIQGLDDVNLRSLSLWRVTGLLWKCRSDKVANVCTYSEACRLEFKTSLLNWLLGWWSPQAVVKNVQALLSNFKNINPQAENLTLLTHNAVAYWQEEKPIFAAQSAILALTYAKGEQKLVLQRFIAYLNVRVSRPKSWKFSNLQLLQLAFPFALLVMALLPSSVHYVSEADLMKYFRKNNEITYYQEVKFNNKSKTVDDMVVAKVMSIEIDKGDASKLYHLKNDTKIMHGPSDNFDVMKNLSAKTTVRLTGITPDNIWYRIMLDSGEMGFVRVNSLAKGIGKPVPDFSAIYKKN